MPKIKTQDIRTGVPATSAPGIATHSPQSVGVAKARGQHVFEGEGGVYVARGLDKLTKGLTDVLNVHAGKAEDLRKANSNLAIEGMDSEFTEQEYALSELTGAKAHGALENAQEQYEDWKDQYVPEGLDETTRQERTLAFEKRFNQHIRTIMNWQVKQGNVAQADVAIARQKNDHSAILMLPVGDTKEVEAISKETGDLLVSMLKQPTGAEIKAVREAVSEDNLTHAYTAWFTDNPTVAKQSWEDNKEMLKKAMPNQYNAMAKKYEVAVENSQYDVLMGETRLKFGEDFIGAANSITKNYQKHLKNGISAGKLEQAINTFEGRHASQVRETKRIEDEAVDTLFTNIYKKHYDKKTGVLSTGAMTDLEQARRRGVIDQDTFNKMQRQIQQGDSSPARYNAIVKAIEDGELRTNGQILQAVAGTNFRPQQFFNIRDKEKKAEEAGLHRDQFVALRDVYNDRVKEYKKVAGMKGALKASNLAPFEKDLREWARSQDPPLKLGSKDPKIFEEGMRRMDSVWYKEVEGKPFGDVHSIAEEGMPGTLDKLSDLISPSTEIVKGMRWDVEKKTDKTATGGTPKDEGDEAYKKYVKDNAEELAKQNLDPTDPRIEKILRERLEQLDVTTGQ